MLALAFEPCRHAEQELVRHLAGADNLDDGRRAGCHGAGFIQQHGVGVAGGFKACGGLLNRIPCLAPTPEPTMIATGVASPSAQGQLMTSTLMPRASANGKVKPSSSQMIIVTAAMPMTAGTKMPATLSAVRAQRGFGRSGVLHKPDHLGKRGIHADPGCAAGQRAVLVDGCGADRIAGGFVNRHALAGQGRFVDARFPGRHHAVHRDALARTHKEHIADLHFATGTVTSPPSRSRQAVGGASSIRLLSAVVVLPLE